MGGDGARVGDGPARSYEAECQGEEKRRKGTIHKTPHCMDG